ncbi:MAG: hypothetical protein J6V65_00240, partial [Fibrobacterales bacterium]|nr:hypothetical protein [Fibrobacterales bacterium]
KKLLAPLTDHSAVRVHTSGDHWLDWLDAVRAEDPSATATNASAAAATNGIRDRRFISMVGLLSSP